MASMKLAKGGSALFVTSGRNRLPCNSHMGDCNWCETLTHDMQAVVGELFCSDIAEVDDARPDPKRVQLLIRRDNAFGGE
jgi:hypothetical protein